MTRSARVDPRIGIHGGFQVLVTEQLLDQFERAGRVIQKGLRSQMAKLMRRQIDAHVSEHGPPDQLRQGLWVFRGSVRIDEQAVGFPANDTWRDLVAIFD
jgi:hypothetical protein